MIKSLKLSALALVMSVMTFQAQAENHAAGGFDCNTCTSQINTKDIAILKSCGDCPGLEVAAAGNAVFFKNNCAASKGKEFSPECKQGSKMLAKAMFAVFEVVVMGDRKGRPMANRIFNQIRKLVDLRLPNPAGKAIEDIDAGVGDFVNHECTASSGKEFSAQCKYAAKKLSKGLFEIYTQAKIGANAEAKGIAENIVANLANLDKMNLGEVGTLKHISKKPKPAPVAIPNEEEAPVAPAADEASALTAEETPAPEAPPE